MSGGGTGERVMVTKHRIYRLAPDQQGITVTPTLIPYSVRDITAPLAKLRDRSEFIPFR